MILNPKTNTQPRNMSERENRSAPWHSSSTVREAESREFVAFAGYYRINENTRNPAYKIAEKIMDNDGWKKIPSPNFLRQLNPSRQDVEEAIKMLFERLQTDIAQLRDQRSLSGIEVEKIMAEKFEVGIGYYDRLDTLLRFYDLAWRLIVKVNRVNGDY